MAERPRKLLFRFLPEARISRSAVLNADDTPIGLLTLQKDLRVIKSRQSIDTNGMVFAPHQSPGVCTRLR
jgi:hypothetical protein